MKKAFLIFILIFMGKLSAQENKIISINSDLLRASYEKLSEETFVKLWDESVGQQLKVTLLDQTIKIQLLLGGGIVTFDELKQIPEIQAMMIDGTFPTDRVFMKHVCQFEFGVNGNIKTLLEAGVSFPYRVTYIESISQADGQSKTTIKKRTLQFFKNYIDMVMNRFDKSVLSLENSLLPTDLILKVGEQFSVERFLLATVGLGSEGFEFKADNPILTVRGKANFQAMKFSKTFNQVRMTVQHYGSEEDYRVTISKKKINTLELLNMEFGFDIKTKKKLFNLIRLSLNLNLFKFNPTWNFYDYRHRQFIGKIENVKSFTNLKRSYLLGENSFLIHKNDNLEFFRTYQISGHSFSNNINLFNFYRNSHQEKIENRYIDSNLNTRENIGFGNFSRVKSNFFNFQKMSLDVLCDYTYHLSKNNKADKIDRSGLILTFSDNDQHGIYETPSWYLKYTRKILDDYYPDATSEFDFLMKNSNSDQFRRNLKIEFDSEAFNELYYNRKAVDTKLNTLFNKIFQPSKTDSDIEEWRKDYIKVMLKRTLDRMYTMNELLDLQFKSSMKTKLSVNRLKTPGQLPMRDIIYLLIATAVAKDNISIEYSVDRIAEQNSMMEINKSKIKYKFIYTGKSFKDNFDEMNFYY